MDEMQIYHAYLPDRSRRANELQIRKQFGNCNVKNIIDGHYCVSANEKMLTAFRLAFNIEIDFMKMKETPGTSGVTREDCYTAVRLDGRK